MRRWTVAVIGLAGLTVSPTSHASEPGPTPDPDPEEAGLPPFDSSLATHWRARSGGWGFYTQGWAGPSWYRGGLTDLMRKQAEGGGGIELGLQVDQWLFGVAIHAASSTFIDGNEPLRGVLGLRVGHRIEIVYPLALRLGGGYIYSYLTDCEGSAAELDAADFDVGDARGCDVIRENTLSGHGVDGDVLLSFTVFSDYPMAGLRTHADVFTGVRASAIWLEGLRGDFGGHILTWISGVSFHLNAYD
ncbi:MAG: hypothetical protein AAGA56_00760 [Myxococcota bacterium]